MRDGVVALQNKSSPTVRCPSECMLAEAMKNPELKGKPKRMQKREEEYKHPGIIKVREWVL